jgi:prevent-host-death family protein
MFATSYVKLEVEVQLDVRLHMETVTLLEFRRHAEEIIQRVRQGKRLVLTYRGKPVMRLEPISENKISRDDPFYRLPELANSSSGKSLTNEEIDQILYDE